MKTKDKDFISEIIASDFEHISNPDFTRVTLEKIAKLEDDKISHSTSGDVSFLIPQLLYASLYILLYFVTTIISGTQFEQKNSVMHSIDIVSEYLVHPVTFSILISFSLLYLLDIYLKKRSTKTTKQNKRSYAFVE